MDHPYVDFPEGSEQPASPLSFGHYCQNPPALPEVRPRFENNARVRGLNPHRIVAIVANAYEISPGELLGKRRTRLFSEARAVAFWLLRKATDLSLSDIARAMCRPDHTSVIWGVKQCERQRDRDEKFRVSTDKLLDEAKGTVAA